MAEKNTTKINNCSYKDLFVEVMFGNKDDEAIHLIQWNIHKDYKNDSDVKEMEEIWPCDGSVIYSALCNDGIYSELSPETEYGGPFEPFPKDEDRKAYQAPVTVDAIHEIKITGHRAAKPWTNADGFTQKFITDDMHYSVDGNEILHEIEEPEPVSNGDFGRPDFEQKTTSIEKFTEFCQKHPAVLSLPENTCFKSFKKLEKAVKKAEERSVRIQQAEDLSNNVKQEEKEEEKER